VPVDGFLLRCPKMSKAHSQTHPSNQDDLRVVELGANLLPATFQSNPDAVKPRRLRMFGHRGQLLLPSPRCLDNLKVVSCLEGACFTCAPRSDMAPWWEHLADSWRNLPNVLTEQTLPTWDTLWWNPNDYPKVPVSSLFHSTICDTGRVHIEYSATQSKRIPA